MSVRHTRLCHLAVDAIVGTLVPCEIVDALIVELASSTANPRLPTEAREMARQELRWIQARSEGIAAARSAR